MNYTIIEKSEWRQLKETEWNGTDGCLYLSLNADRILKLLYNFILYQETSEKKILLHYLMKQKELKTVAAIPEELVFVPHKKQIGFWMTYFKNGVPLDKWTKKNQGNPEKILQVYQKISEILKMLHQKYGIIVSDCYYSNILIVDDKYPIFLDVDSWCIEEITSCTTSNILTVYSQKQFWNRYEQTSYLRDSENADKAALWLMYLEAALNLPVRKFFFRRYIEKRDDLEPIIKEIVKKISDPKLIEVPYLHEVSKQYKLYQSRV